MFEGRDFSSRIGSIIFLVHKLVLLCLRLNIVFKARHISGMFNNKADALSRLKVDQFRQLAPYRDALPTSVPERLHPSNDCKGLILY